MAQILKDSVREQILEAALDELADKGIRNASMRTIAHKAKMTVGNLYRYYPGKEELVKATILPAVKAVDEVFDQVSEHEISFTKKDGFEVSDIQKNLRQRIDQLCLLMIPVIGKYPKQMDIILHTDEKRLNFNQWLYALMISLFSNDPTFSEEERSVFCKMIASSIVEAMTILVSESNLSEKQMEKMMNYYLISVLNPKEEHQ